MSEWIWLFQAEGDRLCTVFVYRNDSFLKFSAFYHTQWFSIIFVWFAFGETIRSNLTVRVKYVKCIWLPSPKVYQLSESLHSTSQATACGIVNCCGHCIVTCICPSTCCKFVFALLLSLCNIYTASSIMSIFCCHFLTDRFICVRFNRRVYQ